MPKERKLTALGEWIEEYLKTHEMSLRELATRMDYSHAQVSRVKYGSVKPSPKFMRQLSYATGAPENDLLITAYGRPRVEAARAGAKRISNLSSSTQQVLMSIAMQIAQLPSDEQRLAIGWFQTLAQMSDTNRAKAIREITTYLQH